VFAQHKEKRIEGALQLDTAGNELLHDKKDEINNRSKQEDVTRAIPHLHDLVRSSVNALNASIDKRTSHSILTGSR
jgi:hypothetical protein